MNPFKKDECSVQILAYPIETILSQCDINRITIIDDTEVKRINFNPFIFVDATKQYYQRPLVWCLQDKQLLIDSIYNGIDCGKILIRKRSYKQLSEFIKNGESELFLYDVVDGKQRLCTLQAFVNNEFQDSYGNYYSDLNPEAHIEFMNSMLFTFGVMPESTSDANVIRQFLKLNVCGIPQSLEHVEFVKSLCVNL